MTTREEAAAKALYQHNATDNEGGPIPDYPADEFTCCATEAIKAADAHDAAHGIHRLVIDAKTVERAARRLVWRIPDLNPAEAMDHVRAVLAASVEANQ